MADGQFRFAYFTPVFDETVAFYRDGLGMAVSHAWDRSPDDRGALIKAGAGLIEVLALPSGSAEHLFDSRPPQGAFMVIEVEDVDDCYQRALKAKLSVQQDVVDQSWGHRGFCLREPNGLRLYFFRARPKSG